MPLHNYLRTYHIFLSANNYRNPHLQILRELILRMYMVLDIDLRRYTIQPCNVHLQLYDAHHLLL